MKTVKKVFNTKREAQLAFDKLAIIEHTSGRASAFNFGTLFIEANTLIAKSSYWSESVLENYLDGKASL